MKTLRWSHVLGVGGGGSFARAELPWLDLREPVRDSESRPARHPRPRQSGFGKRTPGAGGGRSPGSLEVCRTSTPWNDFRRLPKWWSSLKKRGPPCSYYPFRQPRQNGQSRAMRLPDMERLWTEGLPQQKLMNVCRKRLSWSLGAGKKDRACSCVEELAALKSVAESLGTKTGTYKLDNCQQWVRDEFNDVSWQHDRFPTSFSFSLTHGFSLYKGFPCLRDFPF